MASHIDLLVRSIEEQGLASSVAECIFVNDGSTDDTLERIQANNRPWLRVINLPKNQGRYWARFHGAKAAKLPSLLFLDTRLELENGFVERLRELHPLHEALMGVVRIDTRASLYSLYWERTHRWIWRKHFKAAESGFFLTKENFDQYLKGTTVFLCPRDMFLEACEAFRHGELLSDDNAIMKVVVEKYPIWVDPGLAIWWKPRETLDAFLLRLWERGPSFVEYYVFGRYRGIFFWASLLLLACALIWIFLMVLNWEMALWVFSIGVGLVILSTSLFCKSPKEFLRMAPLHLAVVLTFSTAILYGLAFNMRRLIPRKV